MRLSTELLKDKVGRYLFTSSTGVYYPYLSAASTNRRRYSTRRSIPRTNPPRLGSQGEVRAGGAGVFGDRGVVVRPTYIVGPGDTTDRFPYWPERLARGGEVLAPGRRDDPMQFVDVRDLAEFMVHLLEDRPSGIYNVVGPQADLTMPRVLIRPVRHSTPRRHSPTVDDYEFLAEHKIDEAIPWAMLKGNDDGMMSIRHERAEAAGLIPIVHSPRPFETRKPGGPRYPSLAQGCQSSRSPRPGSGRRALTAWHTRKRLEPKACHVVTRGVGTSTFHEGESCNALSLSHYWIRVLPPIIVP